MESQKITPAEAAVAAVAVSMEPEIESLQDVQRTCSGIRQTLARVIVGQDDVIHELIVALVTGGHVLLEGVPGLAKTTLISTLASAAGLKHNRIQFTPDLMPGDILGSEILDENPHTRERSFRYVRGPIFTQVLLADEINRTPPKTQAALLQAMQERQVSYAGTTHTLPSPFLVFATQNPIENEGTYPLPEAQLDRFMLKVKVGYPDAEDEKRIALINPHAPHQDVSSSAPAIDWPRWRQLLGCMPATNSLIDAAVALVRATRPESSRDEFIVKNVRWGAGPRASQFLILASKGLAASEGRATPDLNHLRRIAHPVLRHRIIPSFSAQAERTDTEAIIRHLMARHLIG